ncbi:MAG: ABC transporter permease, partial [Micromonosporaceae bacterium]
MDREQRMKLLPWVSTPVMLVLLVAGWQAAVSFGGVSEFVLPAPAAVGDTLWTLLTSDTFWTEHVTATMSEVLLGAGLALVIGVVVGVVLGRVLWLEVALRPALVAMQVIPKVALVPLFVIWFGFGMSSKVVIAMLLAFFPIMLNTLLGVRSVDSGHRDVMIGLGASRWETFRRLELPSTLPYVFTGMQVAVVFAVIGAIVGEFLGGNHGLGFLVVSSLNALDAAQLFAVIVVLATL